MRESPRGLRRIELYNKSLTTSQRGEDPTPYFVLELEEVLHVQGVEPKSVGRGGYLKAGQQQKFEFCTLTTTGKHQFATKTLQECQDWISKLNSLLLGPPEPRVTCEYSPKINTLGLQVIWSMPSCT